VAQARHAGPCGSVQTRVADRRAGSSVRLTL